MPHKKTDPDLLPRNARKRDRPLRNAYCRNDDSVVAELSELQKASSPPGLAFLFVCFVYFVVVMFLLEPQSGLYSVVVMAQHPATMKNIIYQTECYAIIGAC